MILSLLLTILPALRRDMNQYMREVMARELVTNFAAGRFDALTKDFNDSLRSAMQPDTFSTLEQQIEAAAGAFRFIRTVSSSRDKDGSDSVEVIVQYAKAPVAVQVVFDKTNHIGSVYMNPMIQQVDPKLAAFARELHANFLAGHFDLARARFDGSMLEQLTTAKLEQLRQQVESEFGAFRSITDVREYKDHGMVTIDLIASYEKMPMLFRVVFDSQQRISGLKVAPFREQ